jgi:hypothetical protein
MEEALLREFNQIQAELKEAQDGEADPNLAHVLDGLEDLENDPLLAADFNIIDYFNDKYKDEKKLENICGEIQHYDQ